MTSQARAIVDMAVSIKLGVHHLGVHTRTRPIFLGLFWGPLFMEASICLALLGFKREVAWNHLGSYSSATLMIPHAI